ncbi:MAG: glutathione S-transferase family protein [Pseudomonadota bacterium]
MLRVLGRMSSINVRKVLWTAAEAGCQVDHDPAWGDGLSTRSPEFLALNPNGLIPVAITRDGALWESNTICRFLVSAADRDDLLPNAPFARAQVEKWMDWQAADLNAAWRPAFLALVRGDRSIAKEEIQRSGDQWNSLMSRLEQRIGETGAYVAGSTFTVADVGIGLSLQRWLLTPMQRPAAPALSAYRARLLDRPAAQTWAPPDIP